MAPPLLELFPTPFSISCSETLAVASLVLGLTCIASYLRWMKRATPYPPGPPPDPILGNARQLVKIDNQERAFADWESTYGWLLPFVNSYHMMCDPCQRRCHLHQCPQQVNLNPQLLLGCEGSPGEEERDLF